MSALTEKAIRIALKEKLNLLQAMHVTVKGCGGDFALLMPSGDTLSDPVGEVCKALVSDNRYQRYNYQVKQIELTHRITCITIACFKHR